MKRIKVKFKKTDVVVFHKDKEEIFLLTNVFLHSIISSNGYWRSILDEYYTATIHGKNYVKVKHNFENFKDYVYMGEF